jgi:4-oxalocrotonate tautomerase
MPVDQEGVAMPLIQINLAAGRTDDQKRALLQAVTDAVESSIGAPLESIRVWISEFEPTEYMAGGELLADRRAAQAAS